MFFDIRTPTIKSHFKMSSANSKNIKNILPAHLVPNLNRNNHEHITENRAVADFLTSKVRVLCWIMTGPSNHLTKAIHVKETWGKRCNKLLLMSSEIDDKLDTIALPVEEGRERLWNKTKEAFKYIYKHHLNDADWFLKADDDTYVIVENLRYMLYPYSPEAPVYFGCRFKPYVQQGYMSGGAGYVLSKEALTRFVEIALKNETCNDTNFTGAEDVKIGQCLQDVSVIAGDSRDDQLRGRFFPFSPINHLLPPPFNVSNYWYWQYQYYKDPEGLNCCSDYTIAFHYISPESMYLYDFFIYHLRPYGITYSFEELPAKRNVSATPLSNTTDYKYIELDNIGTI